VAATLKFIDYNVAMTFILIIIIIIIVESCPLTKLNGGLSRLHSADKDAVSSLTSCGSWHAYKKKCCCVHSGDTFVVFLWNLQLTLTDQVMCVCEGEGVCVWYFVDVVSSD